MFDSISEERKKVSKTGHIKRSDDLIAQLSKPNVAAQKRSAKPGITWDEVLFVDMEALRPGMVRNEDVNEGNSNRGQ